MIITLIGFALSSNDNMIDSRVIMIKIIVIMMVTMPITATTMTVLMTRYPPFHGFGAHTYNWDCGSAFYDTSVKEVQCNSWGG